MTTDGTQWDREKIQRYLPMYEAQICNIKQSVTGAPDKLLWLGTKSGEYSVKSGYYKVVEEETLEARELIAPNFNWSKNIWNMDCAPKVKLFSWKIMKRAVPVGELLLERHIAVDPTCKRCGCTESITHLFFHCPFARKVWRLAPFQSEVECSGMIDLEASWFDLCSLKCLPPSGVAYGSLFLWVLWCLWKARNRLVFENVSAAPEDTLSTAIRLAREWSLDHQPETSQRRSLAGAEQQSPINTMVVRTDAAWNSTTEMAGLGWAILSEPQIQEFKSRLGCVTSPLMAEALALRDAVLGCHRRSLKLVRFESDSAQLVSAINLGKGVPALHGIVSDILSCVSDFDFVCFAWIPRERNGVAHMLAKTALNVAEQIVVDGAFTALN